MSLTSLFNCLLLLQVLGLGEHSILLGPVLGPSKFVDSVSN